MRAVVTAMVCVVLLGFAYAIHIASYLPQFTYASITVKGTAVLSASDVQIFSQKYLSEHTKGYISETNIFVFKAVDLENALSEKFHRIKRVQVEPDSFFANSLTVSIEERQTFARWCNLVEKEDTCYALDGNGFVFAPLDAQASTSNATAYTFRGPLATSSNSYITLLPIGGQYATGHFSGILSLIESLGQAGYITTEISTENSQDVQVELQQGFYIKASYGASPDEVTKNLKLVRSSDALKDKQSQLEYVDLRFGNRVYYKFKGSQQVH